MREAGRPHRHLETDSWDEEEVSESQAGLDLQE